MDAEYAAARSAAVVIDRMDRAFVRAHGRDPLRMIQGLVTNDVAGAPEGQGVYSALLTPKGKMVADLRVFRRGAELLLDCDTTALPGLLEHLRKYVPPLFARFEDVSAVTRALGVYGPRAQEMLMHALAVELPAAMAEDAFIAFDDGASLVVRTRYAGDEGFDVIAHTDAIDAMTRELGDAGATRASMQTLEVLRIEGGWPRWGAELDETVIPLEAGLRQRAISETKGCYTGQEVIVRILHRGHVNRHLRGLLLGDANPPEPRTEIVRPDDGKAVGVVTSACYSPAHMQTIGLGYVRREIGVPVTLRLHTESNADVTVVDLPFPSTDLGGPVQWDVS